VPGEGGQRPPRQVGNTERREDPWGESNGKLGLYWDPAKKKEREIFLTCADKPLRRKQKKKKKKKKKNRSFADANASDDGVDRPPDKDGFAQGITQANVVAGVRIRPALKCVNTARTRRNSTARVFGVDIRHAGGLAVNCNVKTDVSCAFPCRITGAHGSAGGLATTSWQVGPGILRRRGGHTHVIQPRFFVLERFDD